MLEFINDNVNEIIQLTTEHMMLVGISILGAILVGVPLGIVVYQQPRLRTVVLGLVNILQTIPSLALFALLIPLPLVGGIGARTALIAMVLYSLLPIVANTFAGLMGVNPAVREAAVAMGMTDRQLLWKVELPLAIGVVFTGIRIATVMSIGLATIAAAIGAGGLGMFIFRGLAMLDTRLIVAGALPAAAMALLANYGLGLIERRIGGRSASMRQPA
ncbi:MAG TPA: ABC transporter permease [Nitrospiraceae bacterium]|nr:ABC transporter permease [Nitrospiraceae bacterium]